MNNSNDPNSLARAATAEVSDILETGKGFSNITMYDDSLKEYMERTRNNPYTVSHSISNRFQKPITTREAEVNKNIKDNIISAIRGGY